MDLRSLINKLNTIEQRKLLQESEQLMEKARIRYSDVETVANQYPTDAVARGQALAKLAKENGLPGLFDPVSRELVNPDGSLSTFKGADQATVQRLEQWGLLPQGAKTSSWLGLRGENEKTAMSANQSAQGRDALTDKANALMDKAMQAAASVMPKANQASESVIASSGIAGSLMEEFGYNGIALLESITPEEHTELKKIVQDLTKTSPSDPDVVEVTTNYKNYIKQRDQIIKRIMDLIAVIKSKAPAAVKESVNKSKDRMIAEGRVQVLEDGKRYMRDGLEWTYDASTDLYSHLNEDGTITEYDSKQFWQDSGDALRGVGSGLTAGYSDNISAGIQALFTNKSYKDALKGELAKTKTAQERSPWLYYGGAGLGFIANPLSKVGLGIPLMVGQYASDKLVREPWNQSVLGKEGEQQGGMASSDTIKAMQAELKAAGANLGTFGPKGDGIDGKMGKFTKDALARFPDIAKKYKMAAQTAPTTSTAQATPAQATPAQAQELIAQIKAFAKQNGISDAEAITKMQGLLSEGVQQLNEFGWLLNLLKGGAEAAVKGGAEAGVKGGAEAAASAGVTAAETLPSTVRLSGDVWTKVGNNYASKTGKTLSVDDMALKLGKADGRLSPNGTRVQGQDTIAANAGKRASAGVDAMTRGGVEAGAAGTVEGEAALVAKFGDKAKTAFDKMKAGGGKVLGFMKDNKFLAIAAVLATAGYIFNADGDITPDTNTNTTNTPSKPDQSGMDTTSPELTELQKLVDQLNGGWPTDPETAQALAAAKAAGAKVPDTTASAQGQAGMAASNSGTESDAEYRAFLDAQRARREEKK